MKHTKGFLTGAVTMLLIVCLMGTAIAATGNRTAELVYRDIKITLDGQPLTPTDANGAAVEPFIIDGTTYLPVRAVANALGLGVEWDGNTSTVKLTKPQAATPTISSEKVLYDDQYVTIAFEKIQDSEYKSSKSEVIFRVTNKTEAEIEVHTSSISFNSISYDLLCVANVAPYSTGRIVATCDEYIPTDAKIGSGKMTIYDGGDNKFTSLVGKWYYYVSWVIE